MGSSRGQPRRPPPQIPHGSAAPAIPNPAASRCLSPPQTRYTRRNATPSRSADRRSNPAAWPGRLRCSDISPVPPGKPGDQPRYLSARSAGSDTIHSSGASHHSSTPTASASACCCAVGGGPKPAKITSIPLLAQAAGKIERVPPHAAHRIEGHQQPVTRSPAAGLQLPIRCKASVLPQPTLQAGQPILPAGPRPPAGPRLEQTGIGDEPELIALPPVFIADIAGLARQPRDLSPDTSAQADRVARPAAKIKGHAVDRADLLQNGSISRRPRHPHTARRAPACRRHRW